MPRFSEPAVVVIVMPYSDVVVADYPPNPVEAEWLIDTMNRNGNIRLPSK
jgi:hypothetical protein